MKRELETLRQENEIIRVRHFIFTKIKGFVVYDIEKLKNECYNNIQPFN